MGLDLGALVDPAHTAVLTMEMQRGIVGDLARLPDLADAVAAQGVIPATAALLDGARAASATVVHCTVAFRADRRGSPANAPMLAFAAREPDHLVEGTPAAELVGDLGPAPGDLVSARHHGVSPFTGTALDPLLRSLGVSTIVVAGVSVNMGVFATAVEGVNLGYRVVVAADAVAGVPADYARAVVDNSLRLLATVRSVAEITATLR